MMNDEQGSPDRLTQGAGSSDLEGSRDGHAGGYRGAYATGGGATAEEPSDDETTGPTGPAGATAEDGGQPPAPQTRARKRGGSLWRELPILIVVALVIALVIKTFVVQPFFIPSSSMEDTLLIGDKVLVNKLVYHFRSIQPGDIIVFNGVGSWNPAPPPAKPASNPFVRAYDATLKPLFHSISGLFGTPIGQTDYIKRVLGVPGDDVACCNAQGLVTINGVPLHESSYLYPGAAPSEIHFNEVVPPGRLWVMGDNRAISDDSRMRQSDPGGGTIPINQVIGRAFVIVWPPSHWRILPIPSTFSEPGINKAAGAIPLPGSRRAAQRAAVSELLGAKVKPEAPYVPLAAGFAGAVPLTWLQRRARRRLTRALAARRSARGDPRQRIW
jgi:signal peptidase I